ncbi:MAG: hypothetical protein J6U96_03530 [Elusimicrobiaceae bacterium]|nr:hypothetical protein [Elusimicrobiaceae bacterium]
MSIAEVKTQERYQGDGETVQWNITFAFNDKEDLKIYVIGSDGTISEVTEDYAIEGTVLKYPLQTNGTQPLAEGETLLICRCTPMLQELSFDAQADVPPSVLESGYDKAMMIAQELAEQINRAVKFPVGTTNGQTGAQAYLNTINSAVTTAQSAASAAQSAASTAAADAQAAINSYTDTAVGAEKLAREAADATKLDITTAASTYLAQTDAASTYLAKSDAISTYLTQSDAASTYATQSALTTGLAGKQATLTTAQQAAVDSGIDSTKTAQIQTNKEDIAALDAELGEDRPWQKPADWIDIRNGAIDNSVYFLVGHSADYSSYPKFSLNAEVSTGANTYDVYVDGVKQATTASGTATTLDWQTLALSTGWDVTHPTALRTHVVRVTPTTSTDTLTRILIAAISGQVQQGCLWIHFELDNTIRASSLAGSESNKRNLLLEAVTAKGDKITLQTNSSESASGFYGMFAHCESLVTIPTLASDGQYNSGIYIPFNGTKIKKLKLSNLTPSGLAFLNGSSIEKIETDKAISFMSGTGSANKVGEIPLLKNLPPISTKKSENILIQNASSLGDTFIDLSFDDTKKTVRVYGTSTYFCTGVKGLIVSSSAPFDGASPQINVSYTGMNRVALVALFNSLPTVSASQVIDITGATGAADLTADDIAIVTGKGWTLTR